MSYLPSGLCFAAGGRGGHISPRPRSLQATLKTVLSDITVPTPFALSLKCNGAGNPASGTAWAEGTWDLEDPHSGGPPREGRKAQGSLGFANAQPRPPRVAQRLGRMSCEDRSLKSRLRRPWGSSVRAFAGAASGLLESPRLKSVHTNQTLSWGPGGPDEDKGLRAVRGLQGPPGGLPAGPGLSPLDTDAPASRSAE